MKGTEKIIAHIQSDAKAQADAIIAEAEKQCAAIRESYEAKAREAYAEKIRSGVKICEEEAESRSRIAQMESKKDILALKQELIAEGFEKAGKKILGMSDADYAVFLTKLAVRSAGSVRGEVVMNAKDRDKYGPAVVDAANKALGSSQLTLSPEAGDFSGGLIVRSGQIEVNNTVELLIDLCRGEMSAEMAKVLFD